MSMKKNYKCLMIETKDKKRLFTHETNYPDLIEFSKTFGAEISVVKVEEAEILELEELAPLICTRDGNSLEPSYKLIQKKIAKAGRPKKLIGRAKTLFQASKIRSYIELEFLTGNVISLNRIVNKFKKYDLSVSAICNHITAIRKELEKKGYKVKKLERGKYQIMSI